MLIADILPEVWIPPQDVRELRGLVSYRQRLVKTGAMIRNRLQSLLHKHNLLLPEGGLTDDAWWERQTAVSAMEKLQIRQEPSLVEKIEENKAEVDQELGRQSLGDRWGKQALRLMQLPGIGVVMAMTILTAIGDIHRFESANKLVGYSGLGAGVHDSGQERTQRVALGDTCTALRLVQVWSRLPGARCGCRPFGKNSMKNISSASRVMSRALYAGMFRGGWHLGQKS